MLALPIEARWLVDTLKRGWMSIDRRLGNLSVSLFHSWMCRNLDTSQKEDLAQSLVFFFLYNMLGIYLKFVTFSTISGFGLYTKKNILKYYNLLCWQI